MNSGVAVLGALGSALCFATSSVLQQRGAARAPRGTGLHLDLLRHLVTRPIWLAGMAAATGTLALQALALSAGQLALVQPLLVTGLLFALPLSMVLERQRPRAREWLWATVLVAGLAVFLLSADPRPGPRLPDEGRLWQLGVLTLFAAAGVAVLGLRPGTRHRAALLGATTGLVFGITAALMKFSVVLVGREGLGWLLASWPCYALVVVGATGIMLNQAAFQAGPLCGAMPTVAITEPLTAVVFGIVAFGEHVQVGPLAVLGQAGGFLVMACAIVQLARYAAGRHPVASTLPATEVPDPAFLPTQRVAEELAPAA
jgi:drug/metabolite transporter (DMT)-like permease